MKRFLNIIFKPKKGIQEVFETEPIFSGLLVFIVSVIIGNITLIRELARPGFSTALYHGFILILVWAGTAIILNLMITGILKITTSFSSGILDGERFRKLFIGELYISSILILRPVITLFLSNKMSWILLFIWGMTLILLSVILLWDITEIKGTIVLSVSIIIVFFGYHIIKEDREYRYTDDFRDLLSLVDEVSPSENIDLLGFREDYAPELEYRELDKILEDFIQENSDSPSRPYAFLIKARTFQMRGDETQAEKYFRQILENKNLSSNVENTVLLNLKDMLTEKEYLKLPVKNLGLKWQANLSLMGFPRNFAYHQANISTVYNINDYIDSVLNYETETVLENMLFNIKGTEFENYVYFNIAQRFIQLDDLNRAVNYLDKAAKSGIEVTQNRLKIESKMNYIEQRTGIEILTEKYIPPFALIRKAELLKQEGEINKAVETYQEVIQRYPEHILGSDALIELGKIAEERGEFKAAASHYRELLTNYPVSHLRKTADHKKRLIERNLDRPELLYAYGQGWKEWNKGNHREAINIYRSLIQEFPNSEVSYELQFNIGQYYKDLGNYMEALSEFRTGYREFKNTHRGFDFGWQAGKIIYENLQNYRRAVEWLKDLSNDFSVDYQAPFSGIKNIDTLWLAGDICRENLRDYKQAKNIYYGVLERFKDPEILGRALYNIALIDENIYRDYSAAVNNYRKIISEYPDTKFVSQAENRVEEIYDRGVRLLEQSR